MWSPRNLILIVTCVLLKHHYVQGCSDYFKESITQEIKQLIEHQYRDFEAKIEGIHYRLDQMGMMGVQIGTIAAEVEAITGRSSQTQLATEDVQRMQENMNEDLQFIKEKVQSHETNFIQLKNASSNSIEIAQEHFLNLNIGITDNTNLLQNVSENLKIGITENTNLLQNVSENLKIDITENTNLLQNVSENLKIGITDNTNLLQNVSENVQGLDDSISQIKLNMSENVKYLKDNLQTAIIKNNYLLQNMSENAKRLEENRNNITSTINSQTDLLINLTETNFGNVEQVVQSLDENLNSLQTSINNVTEDVELFRKSLIKPRNCHDIYIQGGRMNGIYNIYPRSDINMAVKVKCQFDIASKFGWTIILARMPTEHPLDFNRGWDAYKLGFGDVNNEYWIGLSVMRDILISCDEQVLDVDLMDWNGRTAHAQYKEFYIGDEASGYTLTVGGFSGDAGDNLKRYNGMMFTTKDKDNDKYDTNCANHSNYDGAGWWYTDCTVGYHILMEHRKKNDGTGIRWKDWKAENLMKVTFKIRPKDLSLNCV